MSESENPQPIVTDSLKKPHQHGQQVADYMTTRGYPENAARDLVARDLWNERTRAERDAAKEQSLIDPLTGLYNRRWLLGDEKGNTVGALQERFQDAIRLDHPLAVVMVDMDFFKRVNDTYGHDAGDQVLRQVAARLRRGVRANDAVVRYGGEEFVIVMSFANNVQPGDTDRLSPQASLLEVAERLRADFQDHPFSIDDREHQMTSSIGAALYDPHQSADTTIRQASDLFKAADVAAYQGKEQGRNHVALWTPDMGFEKESSEQSPRQ